MTPSARADQQVPRYTSYPTAPHFTPKVDAAAFAGWLGQIGADQPLSLYVHVPFCRRLCHYCGCTTTITSHYEPIADFLSLLKAEIDLVASRLAAGPTVTHLHFGGGTPTILGPDDFLRLRDALGERFAIGHTTDFAVEVDPRTLDAERVDALARCGVTRVSLGVQDFDGEVQRAINRVQPYELVRAGVERLRDASIVNINFDLIYGLPRQTVATVEATIDQAATLAPARIALFGYAHVPWMKRHQMLLERYALPDAAARVALASAAQRRLQERGYAWIGLDHFALPGDSMAQAAADHTLRRNFQGYTTDDADTLIGLGPSAISTTRQGYAQSAPNLRDWSETVGAGRLATSRGIALDRDDLIRRDLIERLMCDLAVDLEDVAKRHGIDADSYFRAECDSLVDLQRDGIVSVDGMHLRVTAVGRPLVRTVAARFDRYLQAGLARHSAAV